MPGIPMNFRVAEDVWIELQTIQLGDRTRFINAALRFYIKELEKQKNADKTLKKELDQRIRDISVLQQEIEERFESFAVDLAGLEQVEVPELRKMIKELTARVAKLEGKKAK